MFKAIRDYFKRRFGSNEKGDDYTFVKDDFHLYEHGGTWGNKIQFLDYEQGAKKQDVCGWKPTLFGPGRPDKGDLLKVPMQSGIDTVWVFVSVRYETNPPDMFFGKVEFMGYEEQLEELLNKQDELRESN